MFSQNLKRLLAENNLKQKDLAKKLDVSPQTVSAWCNGQMPRMNMVEAICEALECPLDELTEPSRTRINQQAIYLLNRLSRSQKEEAIRYMNYLLEKDE